MSRVERAEHWAACDRCGELPHTVEHYTGAMHTRLVVATCEGCGWIHGPCQDPNNQNGANA